MRRCALLSLLVGLAGLSACLPVDDRPEPATVMVTVEPSEATTDGFVTADGWTITLERFLSAVGDVELEDPETGEHGDQGDEGSCNEYTQSRYDRLYDFTRSGPEKLSISFGLGRCSLRFELGPPSTDSVLGPGVTDADRDMMRIKATDPYAEDERVAALVDGRAQRDGVSKRFAWTFRDSVELYDCGYLTEEGVSTVLQLDGGQSVDASLVVHAEHLFRESPLDDAPLRFDAFAEADAAADGWVTFAELAEMEAPELDFGEMELREDFEIATLADFVYILLFPNVPRVIGAGICRVESGHSH